MVKIEGSLAGGVEPLGKDAQPQQKRTSQSHPSSENRLMELPMRGGRGSNCSSGAVKKADWRVGRSKNEQIAAKALVELQTQRPFSEKPRKAAPKKRVAGPPIKFAGVRKLAAKPHQPGVSNTQNRAAPKTALAVAPTPRAVPDARTINKLREVSPAKRFGEFQQLGARILAAVGAAIFEGRMRTEVRETLANAVLDLMAQIPNLQSGDDKKKALNVINHSATRLPLAGQEKQDFDKEYERLLRDIPR